MGDGENTCRSLAARYAPSGASGQMVALASLAAGLQPGGIERRVANPP